MLLGFLLNFLIKLMLLLPSVVSLVKNCNFGVKHNFLSTSLTHGLNFCHGNKITL